MTEVDLSGIKNTVFADCSPGKVQCPTPPTSIPACSKCETIKMLNYDQCYQSHQKGKSENCECCHNYKKAKPSQPFPPIKCKDSGKGAGESWQQYQYCLKPTCYQLPVPINLDTGKTLTNSKIKGLGKRLTSNSFHDISSINDLGQWNLCPEDRRRNFLEKLRIFEPDDEYMQKDVERTEIAPVIEVENIGDILKSPGNPPSTPPKASAVEQPVSKSKNSARESTPSEPASNKSKPSSEASTSSEPVSRSRKSKLLPGESTSEPASPKSTPGESTSSEAALSASKLSTRETTASEIASSRIPSETVYPTIRAKKVSQSEIANSPIPELPQIGTAVGKPKLMSLETLQKVITEAQLMVAPSSIEVLLKCEPEIQGSKFGEVLELPTTEDPILELSTKIETAEELASAKEIDEAINKTAEEVPDADPHDIKAGLTLTGPTEPPAPCVVQRNDAQLQDELARIEKEHLPLISCPYDVSSPSVNKSNIPSVSEPVVDKAEVEADVDPQGQTGTCEDSVSDGQAGPNTATDSPAQACASEIPCPTCPLWYTHVPVDQASAYPQPTVQDESCQDPSVAGQAEAIWSNTATAPAPQPTFPCDAQSPEQVRLVNEIKKLQKERWDLKRRVHMGLGSNELQLEYDSSVRKVSEMSNLINVLTEEKQAMEIEVKRLEEANMTRGAELEALVNHMEAERADVQERLNFFTRQLQVEISARRTFQCHFNNAVQNLEVQKLLNKKIEAKLNELNADLQNAKKNWE